MQLKQGLLPNAKNTEGAHCFLKENNYNANFQNKICFMKSLLRMQSIADKLKCCEL